MVVNEGYTVNLRGFVRCMRGRAARWIAAVLALVACNAVALAQSQPPQDLSTFPFTTLTIKSGATVHRFRAWVADTPARQEQGLMFVRELSPDQAMVFTHCCTGIWMKNTYIELDIVFVAADGHILKIAPRARPFDETTIRADGDVDDVVELKGGEAEALKLKVGDHVDWSAKRMPEKS